MKEYSPDEGDIIFEFLEKVDSMKSTADKIDYIYGHFDDYLTEGKRQHVDNILYVFESVTYFKEWPISLHLVMLTATLPERGLIRHRKSFVDACVVEFARRDRSEEEIRDLLQGLD